MLFTVAQGDAESMCSLLVFQKICLPWGGVLPEMEVEYMMIRENLAGADAIMLLCDDYYLEKSINRLLKYCLLTWQPG